MNEALIDLSALREPCADQVTQAFYAKHGAQLQRFGERGRKTCRQDILHHLDYLQAALSNNAPNILVQYALWLRDVLSSRGVPAQHLGFSFELLIDFFAMRLSAGQSGPVKAIIEAALSALDKLAPPALIEKSRLPALPEMDVYQSLVLQGHHRPAYSVLNKAMDAGHSLAQVSVQMVQPALYKVGHLWQKSQITVSQEHLATAISQNILASAYMRASFAPPVGKSAMFACVEGNHHCVGLQMLSDAFETSGWDVFNLGSDLPMMDLVRQVDAQRPDLLGLSIMLPHHAAVARITIETLRAEMGTACPTVWVGGLPTVTTPELWQATEADGWAADALHALEQL